MDSKIISISVPSNMLKVIDEASATSFQTRSNFIRMAVVKFLGAKSQYELVTNSKPSLYTDKQIFNIYDFEDEWRESKKI